MKTSQLHIDNLIRSNNPEQMHRRIATWVGALNVSSFIMDVLLLLIKESPKNPFGTIIKPIL